MTHSLGCLRRNKITHANELYEQSQLAEQQAAKLLHLAKNQLKIAKKRELKARTDFQISESEYEQSLLQQAATQEQSISSSGAAAEAAAELKDNSEQMEQAIVSERSAAVGADQAAAEVTTVLASLVMTSVGAAGTQAPTGAEAGQGRAGAAGRRSERIRQAGPGEAKGVE